MPYEQPPRFTSSELLALYSQSIELQTILGYVARRFGAYPLYAQRMGTDERLKPADHPIAKILRRPNAFMSARACKKVQCIHYEIIGEAVAVVLAPGEDDGIDEWTYLPILPFDVTIKADGDYRIKIGGEHWIFPPERVVHIRDLDPCDIYGRGRGRGEAASDEVQISENASKYTRTFFHNSARPEHLVMLKGSKNPQDAKDAEVDWNNRYRGVTKAWQTAHFVTGDWDIKNLTTQFKDLTMTELREYELDSLRYLWNVSPELLGKVENSNRATIQAALEIEARTSLGPRLELWAEELEYQLTQIIPDSDDIQIVFDSPMPEDRAFKLEAMWRLPGAFTVNEAREVIGMPRLKGGDVFMRRPNDGVWEIEAGDIIEVLDKRKSATPPPLPPGTILMFAPEESAEHDEPVFSFEEAS